jgi:AcrR family transcriptional regulator
MQAEEKKPYHHGDLREALLVAAETALTELPLEEVSLREIARRAGVSHAAPKHHFGSLGQLLGEMAAIGFERFVVALDAAAMRDADQSHPARLRAMSRAYVSFATANPAIYGLMFGKRANVVEFNPRLAMASLAAWTQLETEVAGIIGRSRASSGAATVWSLVHGFAMLRLDKLMPPHVSPDQALDAAVRTIVAGLEADA